MLCKLSGEGETKKSVILFTFILLFALFTIPPQTRIKTTIAETLYVGSGQNYSSIQEAIDNATTGDIIFVYNGVYYETINITIDGITIKGENKENTIIDGTGSSIENSTVLIDNHDDIIIKNFKIRNSNKHGIYAQQANNLTITYCEIYNNQEHGINLYGVNNFYVSKSSIYDNNIDGIHFTGCSIGNITKCYIYSNDESGILIDSSNNIVIIYSEIDDNFDGIKLNDFTNTTNITYCNISYNDNYGILIIADCTDNLIYLNNFFGNYYNGASYATNYWDNGSIGNFWDDYIGFDSDLNGIGDNSYTERGIVDNYPLIHLYGSIINIDTNEIFLTIQNAIDDSDTLFGHTVFVKEDTYFESIVVTKDNITIKGENKLTTIIDASNENLNGVLIKNHDGVKIEGFTIINSPKSDLYYSNGIMIWAYSFLVGRNHSNNNIVNDCIIDNNGGYGILIYASNIGQSTNSNTISNCEIFENGYSGIRITNDYEGGGFSSADNNQIINCEIYNNGYLGYQDYETAGFTISPQGIVTNTTISDCTFYYSIVYDIFITLGEKVENNIIYHNNFISDYDNVYDEGNNIWYNTTLEEGNYYTFYDEINEGAFDNDNNGIIDTPYNISGGDNQDLYPIATPIDLFFPVVLGNGPYNTYIYKNLTFDASKSYDPDGFIVLYEWDLGNTDIRYGKTVKYAYTKAGTYTVSLTVEDDYGLKNTYTTTATIKEEPQEEPEEPVNIGPIANAGGPYYEFVGETILFDASDSYDPDGVDLIFKWSFGDGNTSSLEMPTHSYSKEGNYSIRLTVTDEDGATDNATTFALITKKPNNPPDKPKIFGTSTAHINTTCNYTINGSDIDNDKIQYLVNWSDGTNETISAFLNNSTAFNTSHTWSTGGVYVITIYSMDENNASSDVQLFKVLIDAHYCGTLGYLIDKNGDGIFDVFYRETTGKETSVEKNESNYNIDINDDSKWDYIYNFTTNKIKAYPNADVQNLNSFSIDLKWILLILIISSFLVITIIKIVISAKLKNKQKPAKEKIYYIEKKDVNIEKQTIAEQKVVNKKDEKSKSFEEEIDELLSKRK